MLFRIVTLLKGSYYHLKLEEVPMNRKITISLVTVLALCSVLCSCIHLAKIVSKKIELTSYAPTLKADLSQYKGKPIYLINFDNQAQNTTIWCFFSRERQYSYCGDTTIHSYFWHSFDRALKQIGMIISTESRPDPAAPGMWMTLKSINDDRFVVEVKIQTRWEPYFTKTYEVAGDASSNIEGTPMQADLEKRVYLMIDRLIEAILTDAEFQKAYFKGVEELGGKRTL
jgi:hypothetical protein